jgi:hypothetical protein
MAKARNRARGLSLAIALAIASPGLAWGGEAAPGDAGTALASTPAGRAPAADGGLPVGAVGAAPAAVPAAIDTTSPPASVALTAAPAPAPPPGKPLLRQWWFWGAVGVVAAVGVVTAILLTQSPGRPGCPSGFACE